LAWVVPSPLQAADKVVFKLTHNAGNGHSIDVAANYLADEMSKRTNGRVTVEVFPNNVMGPELACRDMLVEGTTDMISIGSPVLSSWSSAIQLMQVLYSIANEDELMEIMNGEFGRKYFFEPFLKNQHVRILAQWPQSPRHLMSKKPVRTLDDLKGVKIRMTSGVPVQEASWTKLGTMTVPLALDEAFTAVQQGVCDAVEMPIEFLYHLRFHEELKNLTLTYHILYANTLMINENSWKKLTSEEQKIMTDVVAEASDLARKTRDEAAAGIMADFKAAGVEVIELAPADMQAFRDRVAPLYSELTKFWDEQAKVDFMAAIEKIRAVQKN
jgi:TRAP-type C4-dicarboxylate transport system substrate-binding protein